MKKILTVLGVVVVSAIVVIGLSSFAGKDHNEKAITTHVHTHAEGKYCTGTVGCDCRGFVPITDGKEYQKNYCKRCGHHRKYYK